MSADTGHSPLHAVLLGTADLDAAAGVYRDGCGLEPLDEGVWAGANFERHFRLPAGASARYLVLADRGSAVGRVILLQFAPDAGRQARPAGDGCAYGLINLNFYAADIHRSTRELAARGCRPWSVPTEHPIDAATGTPTEVMLDGPDGVILNLVELTSTDPATRIGQMRRFVNEQQGYTRTGLTPVTTTQHCVADIAHAAHFYERACGMRLHLATQIGSPVQNEFHRYPADTRSEVRFLVGSHLFGKVALIQPLNHRFANMAAQLEFPACGYLAQCFLVGDLDAALDGALAAGGIVHSPATELRVPGLSPGRAALVRAPGSGAFIQLIAGADASLAWGTPGN